jgi:hypothetical protein
MKLAPGGTGQLSATVSPTGNWTVTWSSNNEPVATVSSGGLVTAVAPGTAIIAATISGGYTASCAVTVEAQGIVAQPTSPANSQGSIEVSLNVPVNEPFSVSFTLALPTGFNLDQAATSLVSELQNSHQLTTSSAGTGSWLFEIKPKIAPRSADDMMYQQMVHIVYTLDETVAAGEHEVKIDNVNLTLSSSSTVIRQDEIRVPVMVGSTSGLESIEAPEIWYYNGVLHVYTLQAEWIDVYSVTGQLLYGVQKATGEATFDLNSLPRGVLIVRGSSGWVKKIAKQTN